MCVKLYKLLTNYIDFQVYRCVENITYFFRILVSISFCISKPASHKTIFSPAEAAIAPPTPHSHPLYHRVILNPCVWRKSSHAQHNLPQWSLGMAASSCGFCIFRDKDTFYRIQDVRLDQRFPFWHNNDPKQVEGTPAWLRDTVWFKVDQLKSRPLLHQTIEETWKWLHRQLPSNQTEFQRLYNPIPQQ